MTKPENEDVATFKFGERMRRAAAPNSRLDGMKSMLPSPATQQSVPVAYGEIAASAGLHDVGRLYQFLVDSLTDHAVFALSPGGRIMSWNVGAERIFGYTEAEALEQPFELIFTPEDIAAGAPALELVSALDGKHTGHPRWHLRKDGSRFWGTNTVQTMHSSDGGIIGFTKLVRDSTEERKTFDALTDSEQQLRLLVEGVYEYAILSIDADGRIASWNSGAQQLFGYAEATIVGQEMAVLFLAADRQGGVVERQLSDATLAGHTTYEGWVVREDGTQFFAASKLSRLNRGASDNGRGFVLIAHDMTERHLATVGLQHRAFHDQLTNIPNRAAFHEYVARAIAHRKRHPEHVFAVLFIDLDQFKQINDSLGHTTADTMLQFIARRFMACVRDEDVIGRIGGDEFAVLLDGVGGLAHAEHIARRIGVELAAPLSIAGHELSVTASIGIALSNDGHMKPEDILNEADVAMYAAKVRGRAGAVVYTPALQSRTKPSLQSGLRDALTRGELRVHYQPIFNLSSRQIVGFEALVRWQHPQRGLLEPQEFVPLAEATDLIIAVDRWVLREACVQIKRWNAQAWVPRKLHMSVNLSPRQFSFPDLLHELRAILDETGTEPDVLRLEITESAFMERSERTLRLLQEIRNLGIQLHVDDFGTGYSSLAALQNMPVHALKIDSSFVSSMNSHSGFEIVRSIVTLAKNLHLTAIAEGIQSEEHLHYLEQFGCRLGQGFLLSGPLDAQSAGMYLAENLHRRPAAVSD